jgi:hypothetical protein
VAALEEHGFGVEVVGDRDAARQAVLARISEDSSVMTNASMTLIETGIADAIEQARRPMGARHRPGRQGTGLRPHPGPRADHP